MDNETNRYEWKCYYNMKKQGELYYQEGSEWLTL